ncbi:tyrosine-type recombinase/integrase [Methylophaga sp.]|jgi:hypothetical protein|uniref:tyrosine-type recombinase/integrase n=1 Tax=Methylophaga sp. TaxID=2024840 RepID=UPI0013FE8457|nr:tyrosine-type recombinase/integrase [Methylophaga sp.]MTI63448.1 site-specific integrase [Methylophaga sp.]
MTPKTSLEYQKLAKHFLATKIQGDLGIDNIKSALIELASHYRPAYWRRLRCAIKHALFLAGKKEAANIIGNLENPLTKKNTGNSKDIKPKQKRIKSVSFDEHIHLMKHFRARCDASMLGALQIAWLVGCRPAEMPYIRLHDNCTVFIPSAKKTADGKRGLDRTISLNQKSYDLLRHSIALLHQELDSMTKDHVKGMHRIQRRLQTATSKLWPKKRYNITLYSYRHQMGSELKASGMSREAIALIMGHQGINSIDKYGDRRLGTGRVLPVPSYNLTQKASASSLSI